MSTNTINQPEVVHINGIKASKNIDKVFLSVSVISILTITIFFYFSTYSFGMLFLISIGFILTVLSLFWYFVKSILMDGIMESLIKRVGNTVHM